MGTRGDSKSSATLRPTHCQTGLSSSWHPISTDSARKPRKMKTLIIYVAMIFALLPCRAAFGQGDPDHFQPSYGNPTPIPAATRAAMEKRHALMLSSQASVREAVDALKKHNAKKAEQLLKKAIELYPLNGEACIRLADLHIQNKQPEAVLE